MRMFYFGFNQFVCSCGHVHVDGVSKHFHIEVSDRGAVFTCQYCGQETVVMK
jgi:hypothetical protein